MQKPDTLLTGSNAIAALSSGKGIALIGRGGSVVLPRALVGQLIEFLVATIDIAEPDPDGEDADTDESDGTDLDAAWIEWPAMRGAAKRGPNFHAGAEDSEPDDEDCGGDEGEPNFSKPPPGYGAGCSISDEGGCEHDGLEPDHDAERETWSHPDDHPAELFIGCKPANANNPPEAA